MNVHEAIRNRKSVRQYEDRPVEQDKLDRILSAGRLAPSAKNIQEWRLVVVRDPDTRSKLSVAAKGQESVAAAPVVIVCCAENTNYVMTCGQAAYPIDLAICIDHMTLAAIEEGLGSCWIGAFYEDRVKEILAIPEHVRVVEMLLLGYAVDPTPVDKNRKPVEDFVHWERW